MKGILKHFLKVSIFCYLLTIALMASISAQEAKLDASILESTSTLRFITAMTGKQLAGLSSGQPVEFNTLSDEGKQQIFDTIEHLIGPAGFLETVKNLPDGSKLILTLDCDFGLVLRDPAFGNISERKISLSDMGYIKPIDSTTITEMDNPPSLDSVLASAPEYKTARVAWLKQRVVQLLTPAGEFCLQKNGIPFNISDYIGGRSFSLASMLPSNVEWTKSLYEKYGLYLQVQRDKLNDLKALDGESMPSATGKRPDGQLVQIPVTISAGHITVKDLNDPLPEWTSLKDVSISLYMNYTPKIEIVGCKNCQMQKLGWTVHTQ